MGIAELFVLLPGLLSAAKTVAEIIGRATSEGRTELTPAEIARFRAEQLAAEDDWAAALRKLRAGS